MTATKDRYGVYRAGSEGKFLYGIKEIVTPQGHIITHPEYYDTADAAYRRIKLLKQRDAAK